MTSLEPIFDPEKDGVFVFDLVGSEVEVSKDPWRPRGDASAWRVLAASVCGTEFLMLASSWRRRRRAIDERVGV
jgi:hypothetical protein